MVGQGPCKAGVAGQTRGLGGSKAGVDLPLWSHGGASTERTALGSRNVEDEGRYPEGVC